MSRRVTPLLLIPVLVSLLMLPARVGAAGTTFRTGLHLTAPAGSLYGLAQGEPTIKVDRAGRTYVIAPGGAAIGCELWTLPADLSTAAFRLPPDNGLGGGDCDLAVTRRPDPAVPGALPTVAYSSLDQLVDFTVGRSTDGGATFSTPNPAGSSIPFDDRQWMAAGEGQTIYLSSHNAAAADQIVVSKSTDGGQHYALAGAAIDNAHLAQAAFNNFLGPIVVDLTVPSRTDSDCDGDVDSQDDDTQQTEGGDGERQATPHHGEEAKASHRQGDDEETPEGSGCPSTGGASSLLGPMPAAQPVYTIFTAPINATENATSAFGTTSTKNHGLYLASSFDGGATWTDTTIYEGPDPYDTYAHIFPALSIDAAGGLWAAWASDKTAPDGTTSAFVEHVFVSYSPRPAIPSAPRQWSLPLRVDTAARAANVFPWVVGGASGRADLVWYQGVDPTSTNPNMGTNNNDTNNDWHVQFAQLTAPPTNGVPTVAVTAASAATGIVHHGDICETGVTCGVTGNRNLLDFFQVNVMPADGAAVIAYTDDRTTVGGQIYVSVQCSGVSITTGGPVTRACSL